MFGKDTILGDLQLIKSLPRAGELDELELQVRLCKMLGLAFALSAPGLLMGLVSLFESGLLSGIVSVSAASLGGIGSLIALVLALRVRRVIKECKGRQGGILLSWLCMVAGGVGILSGALTIRMFVWQSFK